MRSVWRRTGFPSGRAVKLTNQDARPIHGFGTRKDEEFVQKDVIGVLVDATAPPAGVEQDDSNSNRLPRASSQIAPAGSSRPRTRTLRHKLLIGFPVEPCRRGDPQASRDAIGGPFRRLANPKHEPRPDAEAADVEGIDPVLVGQVLIAADVQPNAGSIYSPVLPWMETGTSQRICSCRPGKSRPVTGRPLLRDPDGHARWAGM